MRPSDDNGFTLVELLLSMAILLIVLSSVSTALIVFLQNGSEALARDDHSAGVQLTSSYLDRDTASASAVTSGSKGGAGCAAGTTVTNLVEFTWSEYTASSASPSPAPSGPAFRAVYRLVTDPDGGLQLQRYYCTGTTQVDSTTTLRALATSTTTSAAVGTASGCTSKSALTVVLNSYRSDTTKPYTFTACVKARISS